MVCSSSAQGRGSARHTRRPPHSDLVERLHFAVPAGVHAQSLAAQPACTWDAQSGSNGRQSGTYNRCRSHALPRDLRMAARSNCGVNGRCWFGKSATGRAKCAFHPAIFLLQKRIGAFQSRDFRRRSVSPNDLAPLKKLRRCALSLGRISQYRADSQFPQCRPSCVADLPGASLPTFSGS